MGATTKEPIALRVLFVVLCIAIAGFVLSGFAMFVCVGVSMLSGGFDSPWHDGVFWSFFSAIGCAFVALVVNGAGYVLSVMLDEH